MSKNNHCAVTEIRVNVTHTTRDATLSSGIPANPDPKTADFYIPNLSPKRIARRDAFLRLAGEAIAKRQDTTDRPYYGGEEQFEIKSKPVKFPGIAEAGGPRMKSQQWERTNKKR